MKKTIVGFFMIFGLMIAGSGVVMGGQNPIYQFVNSLGYGSPAHVDTVGNVLMAQGTSVVNAVSGVPVAIKSSAGRVTEINVISASGTVAVYDAATSGVAAATNQIAAMTAVGNYALDWPVSNGIVIDPSSSVVSVKYQ